MMRTGSSRNRRPAVVAAGVVSALMAVAPVAVAGQAAATPAKTTSRWTPPRTPDGQPDLQGVWTNGTLTPFERPAALADKAFFTESEIADQNRQAIERRANAERARKPGDVGNDNEAFVDRDYKFLSTGQTSQVVDPPDGRVPLLPSAEERRAFNVASLDSFETMSPWDRCITRGPMGLLPAAYNNGYQIIQTRTHVVILHEMIHEARIIPLQGGGHVPAPIQQWTGDSRGHWEGATLVVDTANFHDRGWITTHAGSGRLRGTPHSSALHLVERFTRVDADAIRYEVTIDDPNVYARSWKVSLPLVRSDEYQLYEYACHEGNQATALMLRGARTLEKEK
jgi:hypothetical protein